MYRLRLADYRYDFVAPGMAELLGVAPEALLGRDGVRILEGHIHPEDLAQVQPALAAAMRQIGTEPTPLTVEWRLRDAAGEYRWVRESMTLFRNERGEADHIVGAITDLGEQHELERRLREAEARRDAECVRQESETRYALAMRGTNEGLWDWNPLTDALFLSSRLLTQLGAESDHLATTSQAWLLRIHEDDRPLFQSALIDHLKGLTPHFECEYRVLDQNGDYRWVLARGLAQRDAHGVAHRMVGSIGDITDRKRAEARLKSELEFTRTLVDSLPVALLVLRPDGHFDLWNRYLTSLTGYRDEEVGGYPMPFLVAPEDRPRIERILRETLIEGEAIAQAALLSANGRRIPFEFITRRIQPHGERRILCIASDISERQRAEAAMRDLNRELESRVAVRTAELAAAVKELESFSYSVSHDLRAPLRAIDGYTVILASELGDRLDGEARELFDRMRAGVQRMGVLIDDLLKLARVSRRPLERCPVNLSALVQDIGQVLAYRHPERQVELEIEPDVTAEADPNLARIALENLLDNAWKFTAHQPRPRVLFHRLPTEAEDEAFCIEDNGAGFDMRYVHKLFGAFQRLHRERDFPGSGIGLATVARIVQRHGGRIWAEGSPGHGARFCFTLGGGESAPGEGAPGESAPGEQR